jgi:DNA end-binding protein Ku
MTARAIASGTISFGLVSIPVKLFSASNPSSAISFNMLHAKDGGRLKQQYVCTKDNQIVARDEMIKGYEFTKDRYVTFTAEELKALEEQATQTIDVVEFIPLTQIDPVYFDKTYYLGPEKGGGKAYALLTKVLEKTGRVALAKYAACGKQYLVMLRPMEGGLAMQQLLYADEIKAFSEVPLEKGDVKPAELELAKQLVDQRTVEEFKPQSYEDDVRKRIHEQLQRKIEGEEITAVPQEKGGAEIIDLMEALKASLSNAPKAASRKAASRAEAKEAPVELERKPARRAAPHPKSRRAAKS